MSDLAKRGGELVALLEKMKPAIAQALPNHISPERIARIALTAVRTNHKLAQCTPQSFLGSLLQASQLGLEVNTPLGQAYLVPYNDVCTLIIGYQGMMDLARRSGMVKAIYAHPVFKGDLFEYELGLEPRLKHRPCDEPGPLTHVYGVARLTDGEPVFTVLTRERVESYRARSMAKNNGPWVNDYNAMAQKTAIRRLFTWLPKSAEMALAQDVDEATERDQPQAESFAPEIVGLLSDIPAEPTPSPVPAGTPDGRRVAMRGQKKQSTGNDGPVASKGAAAPAQSSEVTPPPPAAAPAAAPADLPKRVDGGRLVQMLREIDPAWDDPDFDARETVEAWSETERSQALAWCAGYLANSPNNIRRPAHTMIAREPGEDG